MKKLILILLCLPMIRCGEQPEPKQSSDYVYEAMSKRGSNDYYGALADLAEAIRLNPNSNDAYHMRGDVKRRLNDYYGAMDDYTESIRLRPGNWPAYHARGLLKYDLYDYSGAIADYNEVIKINSLVETAYYNRGLAKKEQGFTYGTSYCSDFKTACNLGLENGCEYYYKQCK